MYSFLTFLFLLTCKYFIIAAVLAVGIVYPSLLYRLVLASRSTMLFLIGLIFWIVMNLLSVMEFTIKTEKEKNLLRKDNLLLKKWSWSQAWWCNPAGQELRGLYKRIMSSTKAWNRFILQLRINKIFDIKWYPSFWLNLGILINFHVGLVSAETVLDQESIFC